MKKAFMAATMLAATGFMFSNSAVAVDVDVPMSAKIEKALVVLPTADLNFGTATSPTGSTATVVMDFADTASGTNTTTSGAATSGEFTVEGAAQVVTITIPATATVTSGGDSMTVDNFNHNYNGTDTVDTLRTVKVSGQLNIADGQATGDYTGTLTIAVNY